MALGLDSDLIIRHPQRYRCRLLSDRHAETRGPLPFTICRLPACVTVLPREMGQVDAAELDLYTFQRWAEDLCRTAICIDGDGCVASNLSVVHKTGGG